MHRVLRSASIYSDENAAGTSALAAKTGLKTSTTGLAAKPRSALGDISNRTAAASVVAGKDGGAVKKASKIPVSSVVSKLATHRRQPAVVPAAAVAAPVAVAIPHPTVNTASDDTTPMDTDTESDRSMSEDYSHTSEDKHCDSGDLSLAPLSLSRAPVSPSLVWPMDALNANNAQYVTPLLHEIMASWRASEGTKQPSATYMDRQSDITPRMREVLVDWLNEVHNKFALSTETLYLTIYILDKFLECRMVHRSKLQLVGCTAMLLAAKYEEIYAPEVNDFVKISDSSFYREAVIQMESILLNALKFNITTVSPYRFLQRYQIIVNYYSDINEYNDDGVSVKLLSEYLLETTLQSYSLLKYLPSMLASSAMLLALVHYNGDSGLSVYGRCAVYIQYTDRQLYECANDMVACVNNGSKYRAVKKKYSDPRYQGVAKLIVRAPWTSKDNSDT